MRCFLMNLLIQISPYMLNSSSNIICLVAYRFKSWIETELTILNFDGPSFMTHKMKGKNNRELPATSHSGYFSDVDKLALNYTHKI